MPNPEYKTGDTWPPITGIVSDANGPVNINTATGVRFIAKSGTTTIAGAATNLDDGTVPNRGKFKYTWGSSDLSQAGDYESEVEVTWQVGRVETFSSDKARNPTFHVTDDLD
jgi:hypothetical protein